jgi:hypothetical protein
MPSSKHIKYRAHAGTLLYERYAALPPAWQVALPYIVLTLAVFAAYINVYGNEFVFDDLYLIVQNKLLMSWSNLGKIFTTYIAADVNPAAHFYRPLQNVIYLFIYQVIGQKPFGFHLACVALHAANAALIYALGRKLNFNSVAAFIAALIWAVHPIHTEAVTSISSMADPLYTLFCLWGLIALLPDFTPQKFLRVTPIFILALLSKETALILPLLVMICMFCASKQRLDTKFYLRTWPLWLIAGSYLFIRFGLTDMSLPPASTQTHAFIVYREHIQFRIYTALATQIAYLKMLLWPVGLHPDRDFPIYIQPWFAPVIGGFAFVIASIGQIICGCGRRGITLSWGLLWFFGAQIPQTGILFPTNAIIYEHWMYLPSIGPIMAIMQTLATMLQRKSYEDFRLPAGVIALVIAAALGTATLRQNTVWHDPVALYTTIFKYGESSARGHVNLGTYYMDHGDLNNAMKQFETAIEISDTISEAQYNLALCLLHQTNGQGPMKDAITHLERAVTIDPNFIPAYHQLARIYDYKGEAAKAAFYRNKASMLTMQLGGAPADGL